MYTSSFLYTKPRLSQARALLFPKVFVPLGIKKNLIMTKIHFRSYIHKKMILFPQRIDKDIAEDDPVRLLEAKRACIGFEPHKNRLQTSTNEGISCL